MIMARPLLLPTLLLSPLYPPPSLLLPLDSPPSPPPPSEMSFSGREFVSMTEEDQHLACLNARLFSRFEPAHKSKIVDYLQKEGAVSAMVSGRGAGRGL